MAEFEAGIDFRWQEVFNLSNQLVARNRQLKTNFSEQVLRARELGNVQLQQVTITNAKLETVLKGQTLLNIFSKQMLAATAGAFSLSMSDILKAAMVRGDGEMREKAALLLAAQQRLMSRRTSLKNTMEGIAAEAQAATIQSYLDIRKRRTRGRVAYRVGGPEDQRLHNAMLEALASPDWVIATPTGVLFGERNVLNARAAHWHRLNFGAGPLGSSTRPTKTNMYFSLDGVSYTAIQSNVGLQDTPSPAFMIPAGVFLDPQTDEIVPFGSQRGQPFYTRRLYEAKFGKSKFSEKHFSNPFAGRGRDAFGSFRAQFGNLRSKEANGLGRPLQPFWNTKGIAGYQFMDAGVGVLRREIPKAYSVFFRQVFEDAAREVPKGPLAPRVAV